MWTNAQVDAIIVDQISSNSAQQFLSGFCDSFRFKKNLGLQFASLTSVCRIRDFVQSNNWSSQNCFDRSPALVPDRPRRPRALSLVSISCSSCNPVCPKTDLPGDSQLWGWRNRGIYKPADDDARRSDDLYKTIGARTRLLQAVGKPSRLVSGGGRGGGNEGICHRNAGQPDWYRLAEWRKCPQMCIITLFHISLRFRQRWARFYISRDNFFLVSDFNRIPIEYWPMQYNQTKVCIIRSSWNRSSWGRKSDANYYNLYS